MKYSSFLKRHNGNNDLSTSLMLEKIGVKTLDELIEKTVPADIKLKEELEIGTALSEFEYNNHIKQLAEENKTFKSFIGLGYYGTVLPAVIQRNIFENPGWYTAYTPYQAEISQGRLEALLNYQTMVMDMTSMPIANASLLDESTAAAEAMFMFYSNRSKEQQKSNCNKFFVSNACFPQTIDVLKTRSVPLNIELVLGNCETISFDNSFFGALIQYPDANGEINDYSSFIEKAGNYNIQVCVASDLMALALITPPGEWGAHCVVGNSQRFGVPIGFGGPHAAFFACREDYKRSIPGRIIGVSLDVNGNKAYRMALQMREQHIKREKATSNICTAQALLAIMAGMYAAYHGNKGVENIASEIHNLTCNLASALKKEGFNVLNNHFFDTITVEVNNTEVFKNIAELNEINFRYIDKTKVSISLDETCNINDVNKILNVFSVSKNSSTQAISICESSVINNSVFKRKSEFLKHPVFNSYHSETEMMRYIKRLENKDLSLVHSMISLGSCTMKLNASSEMLPLTLPQFATLHPFVPKEQAKGYYTIIEELGNALCKITGFDAISFQPNSGAQGEYAGLMVIRAYHLSQNNPHRKIALIPSSAHGTNPASAAMAGMDIIIVKCDEHGNIDIEDLKQKAEANKENLSCLMVTYPSTHGVYEEGIKEITSIIHNNGGLVYMDGANMNAQVGLTSPGNIGADVCHLNLHKTFAIPHGGGGPGMGPIAVNKKLAEFLPGHFSTNSGINSVSAAPFGSALILLISYAYIKMLGSDGLTEATRVAILNANYIKSRLEGYYPTLYTGKNGFCAHEMILDCHNFKKDAGVEVGDIAKRLMDYGFHAPTVAFPVHDTLMVEPTESESIEELDRFCDAMISIRKEIDEIAEGKYSRENNVLKNAPHTHSVLISDNWQNSYSREKAAYPVSYLKYNKFFPSVSRIDNAYGDRNLVCACPPIESYQNS